MRQQARRQQDTARLAPGDRGVAAGPEIGIFIQTYNVAAKLKHKTNEEMAHEIIAPSYKCSIYNNRTRDREVYSYRLKHKTNEEMADENGPELYI